MRGDHLRVTTWWLCEFHGAVEPADLRGSDARVFRKAERGAYHGKRKLWRALRRLARKAAPVGQ